MRHAGMGWPNGAVSNAAVLALPSPDLLMLAPEGRYHHDAAVRAGKRVLWRAIPRIGKRPAELGWSPSRFVEEALNLTDEAAEPIRDFVFANELDLQDERGDHEDDWGGLEQRYALLGGWALSVLGGLRAQLPGARLHWPAWTPDHFALGYLSRWQAAAERADVVDFHAYDSLSKIQEQYRLYRLAFPGKPLCLTEWHCKGDVDEERRVLAWLADTMASDPLFEAAYFFIWRWHNAPGWWSAGWDVEHSTERLALFMNPPVASLPEPEPQPEPEPAPEPAPMPAFDPWEHFSAERIAEVTKCPTENVRIYWPKLVEQMAHCGINDRASQIAMIGTVAIETASTFRPVREAFYLGEPAAENHRKTLAYYPYFGRGFIQLTHRSNYERYGPKVAELWGAAGHEPEFQLATEPDRALDPDLSAAVSALYFRDHGGEGAARIPAAARAGDWREVRRLVQGGSAGLDRLVTIAVALGASVPAPPPAGEYVFPVDGYSGQVELHWGTFPGASDLFASKGTPVRAVHSGEVVYRTEWAALGGNAVQISGDDGLQSYYAHGDRPPLVALGQRVTAGTELFGVGDSGNAQATGPHLHIGIGKTILTGSGPQGGAGSDFDAVALLRSLLTEDRPPAPAPGPEQPDPKAEQIAGLRVAVAHLADVIVPKAAAAAAERDAALAEAQAIREQFVGPKPAA